MSSPSTKAQYLNHLYLLCLLGLLLAAAPAHRALSAGSPPCAPRLAGRSAPQRAGGDRAALLPLRPEGPDRHRLLLRRRRELNGDWLRGGRSACGSPTHGDAPLVGPLLASPTTGLALSYAGLFIDLSMGFLLFAGAPSLRRGARRGVQPLQRPPVQDRYLPLRDDRRARAVRRSLVAEAAPALPVQGRGRPRRRRPRPLARRVAPARAAARAAPRVSPVPPRGAAPPLGLSGRRRLERGRTPLLVAHEAARQERE